MNWKRALLVKIQKQANWQTLQLEGIPLTSVVSKIDLRKNMRGKSSFDWDFVENFLEFQAISTTDVEKVPISAKSGKPWSPLEF